MVQPGELAVGRVMSAAARSAHAERGSAYHAAAPAPRLRARSGPQGGASNPTVPAQGGSAPCPDVESGWDNGCVAEPVPVV